MALPLLAGAAAAVNGELLKDCTTGGTIEAAVLCAEAAEVVLEEAKTDAKGLPAN